MKTRKQKVVTTLLQPKPWCSLVVKSDTASPFMMPAVNTPVLMSSGVLRVRVLLMAVYPCSVYDVELCLGPAKYSTNVNTYLGVGDAVQLSYRMTLEVLRDAKT